MRVTGSVQTTRQPDGVTIIELVQPGRRNAIDVPMFISLLEQLNGLFLAPARVLVLSGAGVDFSSGADLRDDERATWDDLDYMRLVNRSVQALHDLPIPTIARVRGVAAGIGCNLALACDLVVAADDARFSEIFVRRGLAIDGGGSWLLPRLVGMHRAMELALFGEEITATTALAMGLVNRVVSTDELDSAVGDWASRLATSPAMAVSTSKVLLRAGVSASFADALEAEAVAQVANLSHGEGWEAIEAFLQKRDPKWRPWEPRSDRHGRRTSGSREDK